MKKISILLLTFMFVAISGLVFANKTDVKITVPSQVKKGSQITITINVMHKGNTPGHHTDWVYLKINGKEVKRWSYDKANLPPDGNFTLTYIYTVTDNVLSVEAMGDCNIHGSAGAAKATAKIEYYG
jgi:desulfoferrodoxin (superoxide reductase-like protein)